MPRFTLLCAMFVAGTSIAAGQQPNRRLIRPLDASFRHYPSQHFEILSDAAPDVVRRVETLAVSTYQAVTQWANGIEIATRQPREKMTIVLFKEEQAFADFLGAPGLKLHSEVPGYFDEQRNYCMILDIGGLSSIRRKKDELFIARREVSSYSTGKDAEAQRQKRLRQIRDVEQQIASHEQAINSTVLRHEIAHLVLFNLGLQRLEDRNRRWLKEGLAMQFENPDGINVYRSTDMQALPLQNQKLMLRRIVSDPSQIGPGADQPAQAYALAWSLVFYLSSEQAPAFRQYLTDGKSYPLADEIIQFERRFGKIDDGFVKKLNDFLRNRAS